MAVFAVLFSAVMLSVVVSAQEGFHTEQHSLYYIYTALSKPVDLPGIYEFTAMGLLDDREIDYYNSKDQMYIPKQKWIEEKMPKDYWEKGTQSRKSKEQWFKVNVNIMMNRMHQNESDVHVLQWRYGCEIEKEGNDFKFLGVINEYGYDGENFLSFDDLQSKWVASEHAALPTKRKWDNLPILNPYTKGDLEKECVDLLNIFQEYGDEELRHGSPPDIHVFARKVVNGKTELRLTCLATGFHPKKMILYIRKYRTALKDHEVKTTGVRPNHDGTFQWRKSTVIFEDEKAEYDCYMVHKTLKEPIITIWDGKFYDGPSESFAGINRALVGALVVLAVILLVVFILKKKGVIAFRRNQGHGAGQQQGNGFVTNGQPLPCDKPKNGHLPAAEECALMA